MTTQISRHGIAPQSKQGQRFLRLLNLVGKLQRGERKQARKPCENGNTELQDRVRRFERALTHDQVVSTEQMRAAALRLFGGSNRMSERAKSQLTLAFQTHFMLLRAARLRTNATRIRLVNENVKANNESLAQDGAYEPGPQNQNTAGETSARAQSRGLRYY
eukprot:CAMPEP_0185751262 /NCGR_PEP_ID=MMETSP1174-20130828/10024_1 /TAXON_ID=35687 /ORGANISM="Dictyocha speculum, Strain CCMP1381" /LENGTH=161 /DNA_ID=CAMNT_0028428149 /DNA_START=177 /DNA_END=663 /DNA_ORIENTATION=-